MVQDSIEIDTTVCSREGVEIEFIKFELTGDPEYKTDYLLLDKRHIVNLFDLKEGDKIRLTFFKKAHRYMMEVIQELNQ